MRPPVTFRLPALSAANAVTISRTPLGCRSAHISWSCLRGHSSLQLHLQLLARALRLWTQMLLHQLQTVRADVRNLCSSDVLTLSQILRRDPARPVRLLLMWPVSAHAGSRCVLYRPPIPCCAAAAPGHTSITNKVAAYDCRC